MTEKVNFCNTENRGRGRPSKTGRSIMLALRLREGEDDAVLQRLAQLPKGRRSAYIRRVLSGAPIEVLDQALAQESAELAAALDGMWDLWEDDDE